MAGVLTFPLFVQNVLTGHFGSRLLPPHYQQITTPQNFAAETYLGNPPKGTFGFTPTDFVLFWLHNFWAAQGLPHLQPGTFARNNVQLTMRPGVDNGCLLIVEKDVIQAHIQSAVCYVSQLAAAWARTLGFYIVSRNEVEVNHRRVDMVWYAAHHTLLPNNWPQPEGTPTANNPWTPILVLEYKRPNVIRPGGAWGLNATSGFHFGRLPAYSAPPGPEYEVWRLWKHWKKTAGPGPPNATQPVQTAVTNIQIATNAGNPRWRSGSAANIAKQAWAYQEAFRPGRVLVYDSQAMVMFDYTRPTPSGPNQDDNVMGFTWLPLSDENNPNTANFSMMLYASLVAGLVEKFY